jgi:CheY-like chemotaxis protein
MTEPVKVLIIDDEADFCYFVRKNLIRDGLFDVFIATNGKHGIELAKNEKPDIILLDLLMPGMSGDEVAAVLKRQAATANIPILFLTALATDEDVNEKVDGDMDDGEERKSGKYFILPKPVRTKKMIETILKILGKP